jgi:hypothetical protein
VLLPIALKNQEYRNKLDRLLRTTLLRDEMPALFILNLPDAEREAFIDLLVNRNLEGLDVQEMTDSDPSVHREMTRHVLSDYQSKIVDLLGDQFWLYNNYVSLGEFRRETLGPIETRLEMYGASFTREQQIDLIDWFTSDRKRQKFPYASLEAWADRNESTLTVEQKQTLLPILQDFASLDPKHNNNSSSGAPGGK